MSLLYLVPVAVLGLAVVGWLFMCIKNIRSTEIGIVEKRYIGKKLPTGRAYALPGEIGIQVKYLDPGFRFLLWPFFRLHKRQPFLVIDETQIGIVTATDGKQLASDRIFAEDEAGDHHDNFQNPYAFLESGGIRGKQLRFLTNGTWKIHPFLFHVATQNKTVIPDGKVGLVTAEDGASLEPGQFVGKHVQGHDNFQRPERFLRQQGQKGPQIDIIRPGTYNIHTDMFKVQVVPAVAIDKEHVGVVEANAGEPLSKGDVVAVTPEMPLHNAFQDGQKFLDNGGIRGPQESVLAPGTYYINSFLFDVKTSPQTVIKQGEAGVLISNLGQDPAGLEDDQPAFPGASDDITHNSEDPEESRLNRGVRQRHVVPEGYRGIQKNVLGPGKYNINPLAYSVVVIPTTTRSIAWTADKADEEDRYFNPFAVVSHDGFEMRIEIGCQYRILPENAPYVVQKLGSIAELEANVLHPQIDGIVRAQVSKSIAIKYQQNRAEEQTAAEEAVRLDLSKYRVDVVSVMIRNIVLPDELMKTTQQKNLANLEESMWDAKKEAEERRIEFESTKAKADQQAPLMKAEVGIQIADHEAKQKEKRAQGTAAQIRIEAEAEAGKIKQVGDAEAGVIKSKGEATGEAYDRQVAALTSEGVSAIEIIRMISAAGLRITPDVQVNGGGGNTGGDGAGLVQLLLANLVKQTLEPTKKVVLPGSHAVVEPASEPTTGTDAATPVEK